MKNDLSLEIWKKLAELSAKIDALEVMIKRKAEQKFYLVPKRLSSQEARERLGISIRQLYRLVKNKEIPFDRDSKSGKYYFSEYVINNWIKGIKPNMKKGKRNEY